MCAFRPVAMLFGAWRHRRQARLHAPNLQRTPLRGVQTVGLMRRIGILSGPCMILDSRRAHIQEGRGEGCWAGARTFQSQEASGALILIFAAALLSHHFTIKVCTHRLWHLVDLSTDINHPLVCSRLHPLKSLKALMNTLVALHNSPC